ncbi:Hypothetical Protein FCC1311_079182 [Hondaea fermentalgiana]|uniref:Uncharacterized protein n=1 Tax=Hondaea fermentalgiana TaxID=2315210 RepID=A0A2R5GSR7_9STRA|nr:Hypothetical Protein FCC1311_079182 [Hondaea fermentalgiana]|eukprot:GBG31693.1 Hypothetical Protein FCC1311_079182 [Hondaea fermentalgiana]
MSSSSSSSSSGGGGGAAGGGGDAGEKEAPAYTELEVRSSFAETRKYYNALFPYAKIEMEKAVKAGQLSPEEGKALAYPPFGTKAWPAPVHLRGEEIGEDKGSESEPDDDDDPRPFKRRRQYKMRKETRWVLTDRKKKNVLHGQLESQSARYYMMIPPPQSNPNEPFRMVPIHEWIEFKKPPNYHTLSISEAKRLEESKTSMSNVAKFMEERQRMREEEMEKMGSHEEMRKGAVSKVKREKIPERGSGEIGDVDGDDLLMSDDDAEFKSRKKMRGRDIGLEADSDDGNDEEDIDVLAIDRQDAGRGEGTGDADYQQEFQDDEDDGALIQEEELQHNNEDDLIDGAEDLQEAISDDEDEEDDEFDEDEDEDDEDEDMADADGPEGRVARTPIDAQRAREQAQAEARAKVVKEGGPAAASGAASTSANGGSTSTDPAATSAGSGAGGAGGAASSAGAAASSSGAGGAGAGTDRSAAGSGSGSGAAAAKTGNAAGAAPGTSVGTEKRKQATGLDAFRAAVLEIMRSEGGTIDIETLLKLGTKKKLLKLLKQAGIKKKDASKHLSNVAREIADFGNDPISGAMIAKLKQEYI